MIARHTDKNFKLEVDRGPTPKIQPQCSSYESESGQVRPESRLRLPRRPSLRWWSRGLAHGRRNGPGEARHGVRGDAQATRDDALGDGALARRVAEGPPAGAPIEVRNAVKTSRWASGL